MPLLGEPHAEAALIVALLIPLSLLATFLTLVLLPTLHLLFRGGDLAPHGRS